MLGSAQTKSNKKFTIHNLKFKLICVNVIKVIIDNSDICPICGGYSVRIRRRSIDRFRSLFGLVYRYKCQNCQWQGNIRKNQLKNVTTHSFLGL